MAKPRKRDRAIAATVHLDVGTWRRVSQMAEEERRPISQLLRNIVTDAIGAQVEWARTSASSASRCAGSTITGSAANRGIATSRLSFRFVMPRRRRFDSCFVAEEQPRSDYLRTFTQGGVATSARRY
jgi:hypothetical protein